MVFFTVFAKRFSMVSRDGNHGVLIERMVLQNLQKTPYDRIHIGDFPVIRFRGISALERFWRIVGLVRIVKVKPDEKGFLRMMAEPSHCLVCDVFGSTLNTLITILAFFGVVKIRVVKVKPSVKPRGSTGFRIEHYRTD